MAFNFGQYNVTVKKTLKDGIDLDEMDFIGIKEYIGKEIQVEGFFFTESKKYGKQVVLVSGDKKINIPKRYTETFMKFRDDDEALKDIMEGHLWIKDIKAFDANEGKTVVFNFDRR